jgi:hypothetical protein
MSLTINNAITRGLYAEPNNDVCIPFDFVRRDRVEEPVALFCRETPEASEDDGFTAAFILNRL